MAGVRVVQSEVYSPGAIWIAAGDAFLRRCRIRQHEVATERGIIGKRVLRGDCRVFVSILLIVFQRLQAVDWIDSIQPQEISHQQMRANKWQCGYQASQQERQPL